MTKRDARQPINPDGDMVVHFGSARNVQVTSSGSSSPDKIGVIIHVEHGLHTCYFVIEVGFNSHVQNEVNFFI